MRLSEVSRGQNGQEEAPMTHHQEIFTELIKGIDRKLAAMQWQFDDDTEPTDDWGDVRNREYGAWEMLTWMRRELIAGSAGRTDA